MCKYFSCHLLSVLASNNRMQKYFVRTFEETVFELKYDVANDTKEGELKI